MKVVVQPKVQAMQPYPDEEVNGYLQELFSLILPQLETKLSVTRYLCCDQLTMADVVIYNDIKQVLLLHKRTLIPLKS